MKPLEEAARGVRLPSPQDWILDRREDPAADVGVAEATEQVVGKKPSPLFRHRVASTLIAMKIEMLSGHRPVAMGRMASPL
jgi:hypothetical protein